MAGTSVSSDHKEEQYITTEKVVVSEKTEEFFTDQHILNDAEKHESGEEAKFDDSPIEEVAAVVLK